MSRSKQEIREAARARRSGLSPGEIREKSRSICTEVLRLVDGEDPVMVYASKPPEVRTEELITGLLSRGTRVVVPIIERETCSLRLSYITRLSCLIPGTFSVPEPIGNELPACPEEVRTVVVPVIAYDRTGHRLGYGAGYYDRFLAAHPHLRKIGVAFSCQEAAAIPADTNDIGMDFIVTEKGIFRCILP
jgi:5-formyltetrahydrofolate cyclo-ligase